MEPAEQILRDEAKGQPTTGAEQPWVIHALATMPERALVDETALAQALHVSKRTIRRMVARYELPPAVRFGGRSTWQAGAVLRWFEARADRAARQAERAAERFRSLTS